MFNKVGDISLTYRDIRTLSDDGWVNDEVMNAYIQLLETQSEDVLLLNTFFIEILKQTGPHGSFDLDKIHRILRRKSVGVRQVESIFQRKKVVVPVNIENRHWVCYCIDHTNEVISYYDSLETMESFAGTLVCQYLAAELRYVGIYGKTYRRERARCPRQHSRSDCGVFALMNIRNLALRVQIAVEQSLMQRCRRMITLELKRNRLI